MATNTLVRFLVSIISKQPLLFVAIFILEMSCALEHSVIPSVFGKIVDGFSKYEDNRQFAWDFIGYNIITYVFLWGIVHLCCRISGFLRAMFFPNFTSSVRMATFEHVEKQSTHYFIKNFSGDIANKIDMLSEKLMYLINIFVELLFPSLLALIIAFCFMISMKIELAASLLIWTIIHMIVCFILGKKCAVYEETHASKINALNGRIMDSIVNNLAVRLFTNCKFEFEFISKYQQEERVSYKKSLNFIGVLLSILAIMTVIFGICGINALGYYYWKNSFITVGEFVFIINATLGIITLSWYISFQFPQIFSYIGACKQAFGVIFQEIGIIDKEKAKKLKIAKGDIEFQNVFFGYNENLLFDDLSFKINYKEKVGIVGSSGAGKSTFCNLILRMFDLKSGRILIDGQDISAVTQESLRAAISVVPQDPLLFHRSILENIRYGKIKATKEEVISAAEKANASDFIEHLYRTYDGDVGEFGNNLSKGERQRIVIARAILKNADILILDEATSSLDPISEKLIQNSLYKIMKNKTVLVVAHRLSTLLKMDRILVFDKGKIVEHGSHKALIKKNGGLYRKMWASQKHGFLGGA